MHIDGDSRVLAAWQRAAQSSWTAEVSASCFDEVKGALLEKWLLERMQPANHTSPDDKELLVSC